MSKSRLYPSGSIFRNRESGRDITKGWVDDVSVGGTDEDAGQHVFNVAVIEFNDDGSCVDEAQLKAATDCISNARISENYSNGALVLVFIHGWHHNAEWNIKTDGGDCHFRGFREVLKSLTLREAERRLSKGAPGDPGHTDVSGSRCVIGTYIGWNGDPADFWLRRIPGLRNVTFYGRMRTARKIGGAPPIEKVIKEIVLATKGPPDGAPESPLIMIGHSMGALMLESVFCSLLKADGDPLVFNAIKGPGSVVSVCEGGKRVQLPDLLLALNSAADSGIAREIIEELKKRQFEKTIETGAIGYHPPVFISVTSKVDVATGFIWRVANPTHKTDGHDASLFTHAFKRNIRTVLILPKGGFNDFGQDWHSLKPPELAKAATPTFFIDLPKRKRRGIVDQPEHERYKLSPLTGCDTSHLAWVFQVPWRISKGHNDIFNFEARLLIMALVQISGAVMSLAEDFNQNFETDDRLTREVWNWQLQVLGFQDRQFQNVLFRLKQSIKNSLTTVNRLS